MRLQRGRAVAVVAGLAVLAAGGAGIAAAAGPAPAAAPPPLAATLTPAQQAQAVFDRMTEAQRIGQLFMVATPVTGLAPATRTAIVTYHVGNVFLRGRTTSGAAPVRALTASLDGLTTSAATSAVPLLVASDQEGGQVQVLAGPGFSAIPSARVQGTWSDATLRARASQWGTQVLRAGVNLNFAPDVDTVPRALARTNFVAVHDRNYGWTPSVVAAKGSAFASGMKASGVAVTAKHFPGLGHVTASTDTAALVTDTVTTSTSADIGPFTSAVGAGADFVMMSSATYSRIDPARPAVFSRGVVTGLLRDGRKFGGVVVSDDLGLAKAVQRRTPGGRAKDFLAAGGDLVLTVDPTLIPQMVPAVTALAAQSATFRASVHASVLRVLTAKATYGLLAPRPAVNGSLDAPTVRSLQRWLGRTQTGTLDRGTVVALQTRVGTTPDGVWGPASTARLQGYLGIARDGAASWNARTVRQLQLYLTTQL